MPFNAKQKFKLAAKLKLTANMKLDVHILQMPLYKLKGLATQQLEENPLLEIKDTEQLQALEEKLDAYLTTGNGETTGTGFVHNPDALGKDDYVQNYVSLPETLEEHLLQQLHLLVDSDFDYEIGELIIGNIDDNGYLRYSTEDIARSAQMNISDIERALTLIQTFDPIGVGARDLRECILLQLKSKGKDDSLAYKIIDQYLPLLEKKQYASIAREMKIHPDTVTAAVKEIASLEPKPGLSFNTEKAIRLIPDALLIESEEGYDIIMNTKELPHLTLNEKYREMIKQKDTPQEARDYLRERINAARSLISSLDRRRETILKVIEAIVEVQKDFLGKETADLKPLTLEHIAELTGKDKSTVSRAISNKYIQTSWGIVELRYFLTSSVKQDGGEDVSSHTIKTKITDLITNEDKQKPLSDQQIVNILKEDGIAISRRAVTKYREQLHFLSSQSRK